MTKIDRLVAATEAVATLLGRASRFRDYLSNPDVPGDYLDERRNGDAASLTPMVKKL